MSVAVALENVTLSYDRRPAVHHISGQFAAGSLTAIAGANGAGKSTLLKGIAGLIAPDDGKITLSPPGRNAIAYLPQASELQRDFPMSVLHLATTGLWRNSGYFGGISAAMREKAGEALATVGLKGFGARPLSNLSAGQFQRALFARLLLQDAPLILLDEPFAAIDEDTTAQLLELILRWHREGRTVICVLHDFAQIRAHFPQCLLMARDCLGWGDTASVLPAAGELPQAQRLRQETATPPEICERAS